MDQLKESYAKYGDKFETVSISDISTDKFPEAFKGVDAVIHTAAPLPDRAEPQVILNVRAFIRLSFLPSRD